MLIRLLELPFGGLYASPDDDGLGSGALSESDGGEFQKRLDDATAGLKRTNEALKAEKADVKRRLDEMSSMLESLGGVQGLKQLQSLHERFSQDELGRLWKDGRTDEYFERRAKSLREEHARQLQHLEGRATSAEGRLQTMLVKTAVQAAAIKAGVEPTAIEDVELHADKKFSFDAERGQLILKDADGALVFGADGKSPKTVEEWLDEQREPRRHWWPASKSGGASGSGSAAAGGFNKYSNNPREYRRQREAELKANQR